MGSVKGAFANRRVPARTIAVVISCALAFGMAPVTGQAVEKELREARKELQATKERIRERMRKLNAVQRGLNQLATEISICLLYTSPSPRD